MGATVMVFVMGMLLTGCLNTILLKYQDQTCDSAASGLRGSGCASFPVLQSLMMFLGESLCFLVVGLVKLWRHVQCWRKDQRRRRHHHHDASPARSPMARYEALASQDDIAADAPDRQEELEEEEEEEEEEWEEEDMILSATLKLSTPRPRLRGLRILYLALPAIADICGTTIMSIGLLLVPASVFQMCRGSLVLFVGLFSVLFLGRRLLLHQWLSLGLVTLGVFLVGLSSVYGARPTMPHAREPKTNVQESTTKDGVLGILLITGAQLFSASQFVMEEWVLSRYSIEPLRVAGFEGLFGTSVSLVAIVGGYYGYGRHPEHQNGTFDSAAGLDTILHSGNLRAAFLLFALSIASFNFFGLSVTRTVSATSRSTVDTCRTLGIWAISMLLGWEDFRILQLVGFIILVYATLMFNAVIPPPQFLATREAPEVQTGQEHTLE